MELSFLRRGNMRAYTTSETLHTGLITLDRRTLISPNHDWPELFTDTLEPDASIESQARLALGTRGIIASSERYLLSNSDQTSRGYLLRESARVDIAGNNFVTYKYDELRDFVDGHDEGDVRVHFLRQIVKHLSTPRR